MYVLGKGNKQKVVPICAKLYEILTDYISNIRPAVTGDRFFCTEKSEGSISAICKQGIEKSYQETGLEEGSNQSHITSLICIWISI